MSKFTFADGQELCFYDDGNVTRFYSGYIQKYKQNAENIARSKEWKKSGTGAVFRGDVEYVSGDAPLECSISGIFPMKSGQEVAYAFTVNGASGIYIKDTTDEKTPETHVINSCELQFTGGCLDAENGTLVTSVKRNYCNADIAVFDLATSDYKTVTDGDTLDEDPYICPDDGNIVYFSSRGVGRNARGEFVCFSPAALYKLDLERVSVEEVKSDAKYSFYKPVRHNGKLYAIKAPAREKKGNPLLEIILIPWRILQGIAGFINVFIHAFSGKSITEGGYNPAKGRNYDSRKIEIKGNLIDVEKQSKKNTGKKDKDNGFVPLSWQLVELNGGEVIKSGIADFDICEDGTIIATNGRRIFEIKDGKCKKICNTECCVRVDCKHASKGGSSLFGI